uniref:Venom IPPase 1 n=1 Tax=Ectomocoris sp. TaxID=3104572 RepID=A0AB38ZEA7_9HEMI
MKSTIILLSFTVIIATIFAVNEKQITVHVATWNVNEKKPSGDLDKLLGQLSNDPNERPDVVIVGLQEVTMSLHKAISNYFRTDRWSKDIEETLSPRNYVKVKLGTLVGIVLNVYVKLDHAWTLDDVEVERVMTGFGGLYGNKGGVVIRFRLYGQSFCVVNSHFHAHDEELDERIEDYQEIDKQRAEHCKNPSDYIFWLGDLNFRIEEDAKLTASKIQNVILKGEFNELLEKDQLLVTKKSGRIFNGYNEAPITFRPTFKMVPDGGGLYNLKRRPAWTDRILYKTESDKTITPVLYKSIESYHHSDHYPVQGEFKIFVDTDKINKL